MKHFSKYIVRSTDLVDAIMHKAIGASWDRFSDSDKYPVTFPALLVLDEDTKHYDYIYPSVFNGFSTKYIWQKEEGK